jgi:hypothetical protein
MSELGHDRTKSDVRLTSALLPVATKQRTSHEKATCWVLRFYVDLLLHNDREAL